MPPLAILFFFYISVIIYSLRRESGDDGPRDVPRGPRSRPRMRISVHRVFLHPRGASGKSTGAERPGGVCGAQEGVHGLRQVESAASNGLFDSILANGRTGHKTKKSWLTPQYAEPNPHPCSFHQDIRWFFHWQYEARRAPEADGESAERRTPIRRPAVLHSRVRQPLQTHQPQERGVAPQEGAGVGSSRKWHVYMGTLSTAVTNL